MSRTMIDGVEWKVSPAPVPYEDALAAMEARNAASACSRSVMS